MSDGVPRWHIRASNDLEDIAKLLMDGWEPYAVVMAGEPVHYLRRFTAVHPDLINA